MVMMVILAVLASMGIVLVLWCLLGCCLLPSGGKGYCVLYVGEKGRRQVRSYLFLLQSGLIRLPLYAVDEGMPEADRAELQLLAEGNPEFRIFDLPAWEEFKETERTL